MLLLLAPWPAFAQQPGGEARDSPRVFFDCDGPRCDAEYYRTEIDWVNWVRDPVDAEIHVIMTSQSTGAGGSEYQLDFTGRETLSDYEDQLFFRAPPTATEREELDGITHVLGLGLARFANAAGYPRLARIEALEGRGAGGGGGIVDASQVDDPWNLWVFGVNASGDYEAESTREEMEVETGVSAARVTPTWKMRFFGDLQLDRIEQELRDGRRFVDERTDWDVGSLVVYSLADHWSVGIDSRIGRNTSRNQDLMLQLNPAVEYSFFPYPEATRRAFTLFYEVGPVYRDYIDETLLGQLEETRAQQTLALEFSQQQTWGEASIEVRASSYLHDFDRNNVELSGDLELRIVRGLNLDLGGSYARVRDQIYISGEGLTDEERLLELRQESTNFEASFFVGLSYEFGSIYNNVVNNRFSSGRGFF